MSREWRVRVLRKWWIALVMASAGCVLVSLDPAASENGGTGGSATGFGGSAAGTGGTAAGAGGMAAGTGGMAGRGGSAGTGVDAGQGGTAGCPPPAAGGTCNVPACGCAAGRSCYPDTETTGLACFTSTGQVEGADCSAMGAVCAAPFGCFSESCKPYCMVSTDCPVVDGARFCDQTIWPSGNDIAGVFVCRRICDPVTPQTPRGGLRSCPAGFGCFSSPAPTQGASDCFKTGTGGLNAACTDDSNCLPGYYCTRGNICNKYCFTSADCPGNGACTFFSMPAEYAGSRQVGFCPVPQ